ncbi:Procollagen-lysine,2-oxoglutarate 5-dioxygenase 3 [Porphyridium purpureum]|uniref:Procollagen-lysine,2-oxoglutarate 5-dioxygenase 3 n=1 Tax=Porphyridium purpureum TaxID=35688 RepID=A0A5J4YWD5_PORPP|nr:Procollagen-lysine,2-oxoglutarate 5-dioxygenase 3 [Porphyridium purpureum]|eukprot:POR0553..scf209_3
MIDETRTVSSWRPAAFLMASPAQRKRIVGRAATCRMVSERQIPGYVETMKHFENYVGTGLGTAEELRLGHAAAPAALPFWSRVKAPVAGPRDMPFFCLHQTQDSEVFSRDECNDIVREAERVASEIGWSKKRHGSYATTDLPLVQLPETLRLFNRKLVSTIYPTLGAMFFDALPDVRCLRVVDGFVVKYDAVEPGGQVSLAEHRDGSVLSFNIALNPRSDFEGGGTWFAGLNETISTNQGHMLAHASGMLHAGHPITSGQRYILVGFVILEQYQNFAVRFMHTVEDL